MVQSRRRRRHHRVHHAGREPGSFLRWVRLIVIIVLIIWGLWSFLRLLTPTAGGRRAATVLTTDGRGRVQITISGEDAPQRAESGLRLYDGDRVSTDGASRATLHFFDQTVVMLDEGSSLLLGEVFRGENRSFLSFTVEQGTIWLQAGTGAQVDRLVITALAEHVVPASTQAMLSAASKLGMEEHLYVFTTSGPGVHTRLRTRGASVDLTTGEGQQFSANPARLREIKEKRLDPYSLRESLDPSILSSPLYGAASARRQEEPIVIDIPEEETVEGEQLTVDAPDEGALLTGNAVLVEGHIGSRVTIVRVNGYSADIQEGKFQKEIALPNKESFTVEVQAEDRDGLIVDTKTIALTRDIQPPASPTILFPGTSGATLQVNEDSFEIIGTASEDSTGIIVNGYQLQKFRTGGEWKYLVDPAIGNVRIGENTYEVVAVDRAGNRSTPARITIVWKAQPFVFEDEGESVREVRSYLQPGSLRVLSPTTGEPYKTSALEVLIEGETSPDTHSISVNGYTLSLYFPGKITWNYIAKEAFSNYRKGLNRYAVVARNSEGKILDVLRYSIERR